MGNHAAPEERKGDGGEKEKEEQTRRIEETAPPSLVTAAHPHESRIVPVEEAPRSSLSSALTPVVGRGRAGKKGDEVEKMVGGRGASLIFGLNFSRAIHVHLSSSTLTVIFVRANILAAGMSRGGGGMKSSFLPFFFPCLSLLASRKLPGPTRGAQMRWKR